jgi:DNA repair exonuclease SbcCD nuclease subunit
MLNNQLQSVSADLIESGNQASGMGSSDAQKNYVKDLEKQQKKIQKDIQESEKKISEAEKELENAEKGKPGNDSKKDAIREKITAQEAVVKQYEDKLKAINEFK